MNNYDQSSSGINLELNCFYDSDQARRDFEEAFHVLQYSGYRQHSILVFTGFGEFDVSDFSFSDLENYNQKGITVKQLRAFCRDTLGLMWSDYAKLRKAELFELIESELYDSQSYQEFLQEYLSPNYLEYDTRGYCQGDYSEIIVPKKVLDNYINDKDSSIKTIDQFTETFQETFNRLCWDQPIYARLTVLEGSDREIELYLDEGLTDLYEWDKDQVMVYAKEQMKKFFDQALVTEKEKEYTLSWLEDSLSDTIDHR